KSTYELPEIKGRAMVKMETTNVMQMYTMAECKNQIQYNQAIKDLIGQIIEQNPGDSAPRIPILPEVFTSDMFFRFGAKIMPQIMLGLELQDVTIKGIMQGQSPFLILGESAKGKTNIIGVILNQLIGKGIIHLFDNKEMSLYAYKEKDGVEYVEQEDFNFFADTLVKEGEMRRQGYKNALTNNPRLSMKEYIKGLPQEYVVIDDGDIFIEWAGDYIKKNSNFMREATEVGIMVIIAVQPGKLKGFDELSKWIKSATNGLLLSGQGTLNVFPVASMKEYPAMGDGLLFADGSYVKIRLPKCGE
ncbi:MAG: type VII secretion protein EssC, partial [Lachnospiraceae bacterium]|nr:type VII secretion protein EssC [Lachnospiraceae bacterium]